MMRSFNRRHANKTLFPIRRITLISLPVSENISVRQSSGRLLLLLLLLLLLGGEKGKKGRAAAKGIATGSKGIVTGSKGAATGAKGIATGAKTTSRLTDNK